MNHQALPRIYNTSLRRFQLLGSSCAYVDRDGKVSTQLHGGPFEVRGDSHESTSRRDVSANVHVYEADAIRLISLITRRSIAIPVASSAAGNSDEYIGSPSCRVSRSNLHRIA